MLVIGITGRNCAGKDSVAHALEDHDFEKHSLSDVLRAELRRRGETLTRPALIAVGNELRRKEGPAVLARRVQFLMQTDRVVLVSVRNPAEVAALRELPGFTLFGVTAPVEVRFDREVLRGREAATMSLDEFKLLEERENTADPNAQQLDATMQLADHVIENDGSLADLEARVAALLEEIDD